jgi:hypothetical protein
MMFKYKCNPEFFDHQGNPYFPAFFRGKELPGYYFVFREGKIVFMSNRRGSLKPLSPSVSGKSKYPKVSVTVDEFGTRLTPHIHQIVAQTFHDYPLPDGVTEAEWRRTPASIKKHFDSHYWEANHIDHDHSNFHPNNLEWVSRGTNVDKYHEHRLENED